MHLNFENAFVFFLLSNYHFYKMNWQIKLEECMHDEGKCKTI